MSSNSKKVLAGALKLPARVRAQIAEKLLASLEEQHAIDAAIDVAERRWQEFKAGKAKAISVEDVFPDLAKKMKRKSKT